MKVLQHGKNGELKDWKAIIVCRKQDKYDPESGCHAKFEIVESDLVIMYWHGTHLPHYYAGVRCPECNHYCKVKTLTDPVWQRLNTTENRRKAIFDGFSEAI